MRESTLERAGQPRLHTRLYLPEGAPRGSVLVVTGFSEHVGRYEEACTNWQARGFAVANWDLRGHGRSGGRRAFVERFSDFTDDALAFADELDRNPSWRDAGPPILFGHSLGGLIAVRTVLAEPKRFRALALSSPYLGLALQPPLWKLAAGRLLTRVWPTFSETTGIVGAQLTHDPERAATLDRDPLGNKRMTARLFTEIEATQREVLRRAPDLELPLFVRASGVDHVVDLATTRRFFDAVRSDDKTLEVAEGKFHELHQELDREAHFQRLAEQFTHWTS